MRCIFYFIPYSPSRILAPGCKRLMIDNNYLSALSRPNLTPIFDRITKFTENGILTSKGIRRLFVVSLFILDLISHRRKHDVWRDYICYGVLSGKQRCFLVSLLCHSPIFVFAGPIFTPCPRCQRNHNPRLLRPTKRTHRIQRHNYSWFSQFLRACRYEYILKPLSRCLTAFTGPNTTTGHGSFFFMEEVQVSFCTSIVISLLKSHS